MLMATSIERECFVATLLAITAINRYWQSKAFHAIVTGSKFSVYPATRVIMAVQASFLKNVAYFAGMSQEELDSISSFLFEKTARKGELVLTEGGPADTVYFVVAGVAKVFKTSTDGKEQILYFVRPGGSLNDVPVFSGGINLASAEAVMPLTLYGLRKSAVEALMPRHPLLARNMLKVLSQRVEHLVSLVEDLSFRQVTNRVAKVLLEYARSDDDQRPKLTQQEMAALAGTAREMVGRSLRVLAQEGLIRLERHRIVIVDEPALRRQAGIIG